jgi:hypothetical protein
MNRRRFLHHGFFLPAAALAARGSVAAFQSGSATGGKISLREKFFGCVVGCHVGSSLCAQRSRSNAP